MILLHDPIHVRSPHASPELTLRGLRQKRIDSLKPEQLPNILSLDCSDDIGSYIRIGVGKVRRGVGEMGMWMVHGVDNRVGGLEMEGCQG